MRSILFMAAFVVLAVLPQSGATRTAAAASKRRNTYRSRPAGKALLVRHYVGSGVCAVCHTQVYKDYEETDMGRSMSVVTPQFVGVVDLPARVSDSATNREFEVYWKRGKLYESESARDSSGQVLFRTVHRLRWIIGAGANGYGAIVKRGHYLFMAPLSFYTRARAWAPSPGYKDIDLAFSRPVLEGCLFCHSGRARPVAGTNGEYEEAPFRQLAIGCESCHGPGSAHVALMTSGMGMRGGRLDIVNPNQLSPVLSDQICEACHEIGGMRILQEGKSYLDILPGKPLNDYLAIFMTLPKRDSPPPSDQLQQYYEMIMSKCYRASGGRLRCTTCHDPHVQIPAKEAPAYFNERCLTCHTIDSCKLPMRKRSSGKIPDNCIACHMPQRPVGFIEHAALTDHRIIAYVGEPMPKSAFHKTGGIPKLVDLDLPPGKEDASQPLITLLKAYGTLAAQDPRYNPPYLRVLLEASIRQPKNALVQAALGRRDLKAGQFAKASAHLELSLKLDPMSAVVYEDLAAAMEGLGRNGEALVYQQKAVMHDPYNPILQKRLIVLYIHQKEYVQAKGAIEQYVKTFPQDLFMRRMLAIADEQAN